MKKILALSLLFGIVGCASDIELLRNEINPSQQQRIAIAQGLNDYQLCVSYFDEVAGSLRSKEHRYKIYVPIINEVNRRSLDCSQFPEFSGKDGWKEQWIKDYELALVE